MLRLHAGVLHSYRPTTRWRQAWTLFSGPATEALTTLGHLDTKQPVRDYHDARPVDRAFTRLLRVSTTHNAVEIVAALFDLIAQASPPPADGVATQLAAIACTPMSIRSYADALGLNVEELRAAVRRTTGSTPHELILATRLSRAKVLLAEEDLPVAAVARHVGYDDPAYFTRLFTTRVGMSPIAFRRSGSLSGRTTS
jgi:AraC-like DNA-binding protein